MPTSQTFRKHARRSASSARTLHDIPGFAFLFHSLNPACHVPDPGAIEHNIRSVMEHRIRSYAGRRRRLAFIKQRRRVYRERTNWLFAMCDRQAFGI